MALFQVTTRRRKICNGVHIEAGMSVQVVFNGSTPLCGGQQLIVDAFMRMYGLDLKKAMSLTSSDLDIVRLS